MGWLAHLLLVSAAATGDDGSRKASRSKKASVEGFPSGDAVSSRLLLRSTPRKRLFSDSLPGDTAGGVEGGTRGGVGSCGFDADSFACFAPVFAGRVFVGVGSRLRFAFSLANFLLWLRLYVFEFALAWGLKLSKLLS